MDLVRPSRSTCAGTKQPGLLPRCNVDLGRAGIVLCTRYAGCQPDLIEHHTISVLPFTYSVDHQRQQVHAVGSGTLTLNDLAMYIAARVKDGVYDYDQLIELSDVQFDAAPREVIDAVKQARVHLRERPIPYTAIVATPGNATYGLARQLSTLFDFEGATVQIVDTVAAANEWLDHTRAERQRGRTPSGESR